MNSMHQILSTSAKAVLRTALALAAAAAIATQAQAATDIAYWNFDGLSISSNSLPGSGGAPASISASAGSGTVYLRPDHTGTPNSGIQGAVDDATGTVVNNSDQNHISLSPANTALSLLNGLSGNALVGNNGYLEVSFPLDGTQTNIGVSYATYLSGAAGFNSNQWSYSTDGVNFTNFGGLVSPTQPLGPNHMTTGAYGLIGPLVATGLNNFNGTAYLRYTLSGATGTSATFANRFDNLLVQSGASTPTLNAASLPQAGDIVLGLNNSDQNNTFEVVRGSAAPNGGVRYSSPWTATPFIQAVKFDNFGGTAHNAKGNLIGVNFGTTTTSGTIYSFATTANVSAGQVIGSSTTASPIGSAAGAVTQTRMSGLSVSPSNNKIAVVGADSQKVIVYDYTPGNTAGTGAALANGRQSPNQAAPTLVVGATQGSVWKDNNTVLVFSAQQGAPGNFNSTLYSFTDNGTAVGAQVQLAQVVTSTASSNFTSLAYNPAISPYLYAMWSGFDSMASPTSQSRLFIFDPANNYNLLTTQTSDGFQGINLSLSSQTGRELALDANGNLFISAFDSTVTYIPAANFANPSAIAAIPATGAGISTFYYGSKYNATAFSGMDIGFGSAAIAGDYNGDGKVNAADYVLWKKNPGSFGGNPAGYNTWRSNFGNGGFGSGLGGSAVPEPTSAVLLLFGLVGFGLRRRSA